MTCSSMLLSLRFFFLPTCRAHAIQSRLRSTYFSVLSFLRTVSSIPSLRRNFRRRELRPPAIGDEDFSQGGFCSLFTDDVLASFSWAAAQDTATTPSAKPTEHLIGTITALDAAARTITVKEDKSGSEQTILLADTKTLIKVAPGAKDLKNATRITADQLALATGWIFAVSSQPRILAKLRRAAWF